MNDFVIDCHLEGGSFVTSEMLRLLGPDYMAAQALSPEGSAQR